MSMPFFVYVQMVRNFRKPLVMVAPKVLLRLPAATSSLADMAPGTNFLPVLGDPKVKADSVTKVIFVSGKHYYTLVKERETRGLDNVAVVRLEVGGKPIWTYLSPSSIIQGRISPVHSDPGPIRH